MVERAAPGERRSERGPPSAAPAAYRLGDDVVHAAFGEGVVTGVEPGGIVVIRFSKDRSERKLVADLAPISEAVGRGSPHSGAARWFQTVLGRPDPLASMTHDCDDHRRPGRGARACAPQVAREVAALTAAQRAGAPGLATILVGDDPASAIYVANKRKACAEVGHRRPSPAPVRPTSRRTRWPSVIESCNADPEVSGILLQLPLPPASTARTLTGLIAPEKDVDGLTPISVGRLRQGHAGAAAVHAGRA